MKRQAYFTGLRPRVLLNSIRSLPYYIKCIYQYKRESDGKQFPFKMSQMFPILSDLHSTAGDLGYYFRQDLWAARRIFLRRPRKHIDIGSRIDGFIAHLLVFMPVTVIDIRPVESTIDGLYFLQDDATYLRQLPDDGVDSLSSLHVAEHFGLGRYSDPIDPAACFKFMDSLQRVLSPGGRLYFSVPIGRERVEFNAHRVFAPRTVLQNFPSLTLVSFSIITDDGRFLENVSPADVPASNYACGLFEFTKQSTS